MRQLLKNRVQHLEFVAQSSQRTPGGDFPPCFLGAVLWARRGSSFLAVGINGNRQIRLRADRQTSDLPVHVWRPFPRGHV